MRHRNLDGFQYGSDDILGHELQIGRGGRVIKVDGDAVPTGKLLPVNGTCFDFRAARRIGEVFEADSSECNGLYERVLALTGSRVPRI
jgi:aldose 1-epimerase